MWCTIVATSVHAAKTDVRVTRGAVAFTGIGMTSICIAAKISIGVPISLGAVLLTRRSI
jgi:hypothetical protein